MPPDPSVASRTLEDRLAPFRGLKCLRDAQRVDPVWRERWYIHRVFATRARDNPDALAYEGWSHPEQKPKSLTYARLDGMATSFTRRLLREGGWHGGGNPARAPAPVYPGISSLCLVIYLPRGHELIASVVGAFKAHATIAVVDTDLPVARLLFVLKDVRASTLVTTEELRETCTGDLDDLGVNVLLASDELYSESHPDELFSECHWEASISPLDEHSVALVVYTSGSTNRPKGVMLSYHGLSNYSAIEQLVTPLTVACRVLHTQSLSFIAGFHEMWRPLLAGACLVFATSNATATLGAELFDWIDAQSISVFKAVPTLLRTTMRPPAPAGKAPDASGATLPRARKLPHLRFLHIGGEAVTTDLVDYFHAPHRQFLNSYGSTETCSNCSISSCMPGAAVLLGWPVLPTYTAVICAPDGAEADQGELCVGGVSVCLGYLNLPEQNARSFYDHPAHGRLYRTGDIVRRSGGAVCFVGRADRQVKVRGYRVELDEVELVMRKLDVVQNAAVCMFEQRLVGFYTTQGVVAAEALTPTALKNALSKSGLPKFAIPSTFLALDTMLKTNTGKINYQGLCDLLANKRSVRLCVRETPEEEVVAAVFERMLGLKAGTLPVDANLFDMGCDSATTGAAVSQLRTHEGSGSTFRRLSVRDLYEHPTVRGVLACAAREKANTAHPNPSPNVMAKCPGPILGTPYPRLVSYIQLAFAAFVMWFDGLYLSLVWLYLVPILRHHSANSVVTFLALLAGSGAILTVLYMAWWYLLLFVCKWGLIGRYRPGRYVHFGNFYLRHWMVNKLSNKVFWNFIPPLRSTLLRGMGAKIGSNVSIDVLDDRTNLLGWDLLDIGSDVSVNHALVAPIHYSADAVECHRVVLEGGTTLLPQSVVTGPARVRRNATLDVLSALGSACTEVPEGQWFAGMPAKAVEHPYMYGLDRKAPLKGIRLPPHLYSLVYMTLKIATGLCGILVGVFLSAAFLPSRLSDLYPPMRSLSVGLCLAIVIVTPGVCGCVCGILLPTNPGQYHASSVAAMLIRFKKDWFVTMQSTFNLTIFLTWYCKVCGVKVPWTGVEVGKLIGLPEMISIGQRAFLANQIHVGSPHVHQDRIVVAPATIGSDCLLGNRSCLPIGTTLPPKFLLGCLSAPCTGSVASGLDSQREGLEDASSLENGCTNSHGSILLGNPPLRFPRQSNEGDSTKETTADHVLRFVTDVMLLTVPFALVVLLVKLQLATLSACSDMSFAPLPFLKTVYKTRLPRTFPKSPLVFAVAPVCLLFWRWFFGFLAAYFAHVLCPATTKTRHPHNALAVYCWRAHHALLNRFVRVALTNNLLGTPWIGTFYNTVSHARIGRNVIISDFAFKEANLVTIGDGSVLNYEAELRTHTFEDATLQLDRVIIGTRCVVGCGSTLMPGAVMENDSELGPSSIALKGESVTSGWLHEGLPAVPLRTVARRHSGRLSAPPMGAGLAPFSYTVMSDMGGKGHEPLIEE